MNEFQILYYMIFVVIIIFTIYYFWTDLNNLYNTGGDFAEGFTSYSKVGDNFCVDDAQKDLLQTKWSNGQGNREACMQECDAQGEKCSAMEWYDSGWNGSKCHLVLDKDGQGSATTFKQGNRWQDAECYIKPKSTSDECTSQLRSGKPGEKMHGPWFGAPVDVKYVYDDCCNGGIAISEDHQYKKMVKFDKDGNSVPLSGRYHETNKGYNWPTSREQLVEWWNTGSPTDSPSDYLFKKDSNWTSSCNLVDIKVGPSSKAIGKSKTVSLPVSCPSFLLDSTKPTNQQFPTAVKNTQDPNWGDSFKLDVKDKNLTVTRTDSDGWWGQDLVLVAKKDGKGCESLEDMVCVPRPDQTFWNKGQGCKGALSKTACNSIDPWRDYQKNADHMKSREIQSRQDSNGGKDGVSSRCMWKTRKSSTCRSKDGALGPNGSGGDHTWSKDGAYYETCYDTKTRLGNTIPRKNTYQCDYGNEQPICPEKSGVCKSRKEYISKDSGRCWCSTEDGTNIDGRYGFGSDPKRYTGGWALSHTNLSRPSLVSKGYGTSVQFTANAEKCKEFCASQPECSSAKDVAEGPPPPPPPDATFTQGAETYGPEHTFTADGKTINSRHFITQGHCNPKGKDTTNLEEQGTSFCKSIYGDKYNLISDPRAQNLKNDGFGKKYPKIHVGRTKDSEWKTSECTTQGYNIANSTCNGKKCKIGDWSEYTTGITNVICSTKPKDLEPSPAFEEPVVQQQPVKSDQICFNPNTVQKGTKLMEKAQPYLNKSFCLDGSLLGEAANVAKEDLIAAFGAAAPDIQLAQPHLDKAQPHLEAAFEKAGPHLDNAMKKAEPQIKRSIFEKEQQADNTQQQANAKEYANDIVIPPNGDCPNGCQKPQWDNTLCTNEIVDGKEYRKCPWTSQDQNTTCSQCGALLISKNDYGYARATVDQNTIQSQSIKSQNGTNLNQSSTLSSVQQNTSKDYVAIGKLFMVDLSIQKKITLPPITNQEYANLGQLLHKYELDKTQKQKLTTTVNNILNANAFPSSIDKQNSLLSNLEEELDANNFYAPNLISSTALKEAQSDNRLGGSKTAYKKNYKPLDPRKQPRPYNSIWDIFRN